MSTNAQTELALVQCANGGWMVLTYAANDAPGVAYIRRLALERTQQKSSGWMSYEDAVVMGASRLLVGAVESVVEYPLVPQEGLEPPTPRLQGECSTN